MEIYIAGSAPQAGKQLAAQRPPPAAARQPYDRDATKGLERGAKWHSTDVVPEFSSDVSLLPPHGAYEKGCTRGHLVREGGCSHGADELLHMLLRPRLAAAAGTLHEYLVTAAVFEDRVRAVRDILGEGPRGGHDTEEQTCVDSSAPQGTTPAGSSSRFLTETPSAIEATSMLSINRSEKTVHRLAVLQR